MTFYISFLFQINVFILNHVLFHVFMQMLLKDKSVMKNKLVAILFPGNLADLSSMSTRGQTQGAHGGG